MAKKNREILSGMMSDAEIKLWFHFAGGGTLQEAVTGIYGWNRQRAKLIKRVVNKTLASDLEEIQFLIGQMILSRQREGVSRRTLK